MSCLVFLPHLDATAWEFILSRSPSLHVPLALSLALALSFSLTDALANGKSTIGS